tara:strand:- start:18 stop:149 length:132 start_codon:yes stop_codon:yes gene_type:complete
MSNLTNTARDIWQSFFGKVIVISVCAGWVPFFLLSKAHAALVG